MMILRLNYKSKTKIIQSFMSLPAGGGRREGVRGWEPNGPLTITLGDSIV